MKELWLSFVGKREEITASIAQTLAITILQRKPNKVYYHDEDNPKILEVPQ